MAKIIDDKQTTRVSVSLAELTSLIIAPAKAQGFIDYDPTRVDIDKNAEGSFVITFERLEVPTP